MIYNNIYDTIGKTPILKLKTPENMANIYAKLEFFNPGGSVKDRIARAMLLEMVENGTITKDSIIVEPTSGNTGIGLAMVCASLGIKCVIVMSDKMSIERRKILKAYGAKLVLTDSTKGFDFVMETAKELAKQPNYILPFQFDNEQNPLSHELTTACEIIDDFPTGLDVFVAGIGSGGTIAGVSRKLLSHYENIEIIGVEPLGSPYITKGIVGNHLLQGIGTSFIPKVLDLNNISKVVTVSDIDALDFARKCALENGVLLGPSGGGAFKIAYDIAKTLDNTKNILFIVADNGERYLSTSLFTD